MRSRDEGSMVGRSAAWRVERMDALDGAKLERRGTKVVRSSDCLHSLLMTSKKGMERAEIVMMVGMAGADLSKFSFRSEVFSGWRVRGPVERERNPPNLRTQSGLPSGVASKVSD